MKFGVVLLALVGALFLSAEIATASGTCTQVGNSLNCSGFTDGQWVNGTYVPGRYVFTSNGSEWHDGYYSQGYWQTGYYYAVSCTHFGSSWSCTQSMPSYATWTVPD